MNKTNIIKKITASIKSRQFMLGAMTALILTLVSAPPARADDVISEWHQEAVRLSTLPASNLAPVQQTRTMAIVQISVHDAVNGYTSQYETYLPRVLTYDRIAPEAAAIAAGRRCLARPSF